jgi:hypothetical protein
LQDATEESPKTMGPKHVATGAQSVFLSASHIVGTAPFPQRPKRMVAGVPILAVATCMEIFTGHSDGLRRSQQQKTPDATVIAVLGVKFDHGRRRLRAGRRRSHQRDEQRQCYRVGASARIAARRKSLHVSDIVCGTGGGSYWRLGMA